MATTYKFLDTEGKDEYKSIEVTSTIENKQITSLARIKSEVELIDEEVTRLGKKRANLMASFDEAVSALGVEIKFDDISTATVRVV